MPGRNELCPCGSGKKFKKCHGAESPPVTGLPYDNLRRLEGQASHLLELYAEKRFSDACLEDAWEQFCDAVETPYDMNDEQYSYFLRWFEYNWRPEDTKTLAQMFLADKKENVDPEIRRVMNATIAAPYSFYQVVDIERGIGMTLRDVLRKKELRITEHTASMTLEKGNILFARVVEMDGLAFMMGNGTQPLTAALLAELLEVRNGLEEAAPLDSEPDGTDILLDSEDELRDVYFSLLDTMFRRLTDIRNVDGDPIVVHKIRYSISDFELAFIALQNIDRKAGYTVDATTAKKREVDEDGVQVLGHIHLLKKKRGVQNEFHNIASLTFTKTELVVDVNSERRAKLIQKEIANRLGKGATLLHIDITPAEGMMKQLLKEPPEKALEHRSAKDRTFEESEEVQEYLKKMMDEHWRTWPDIPVPALRGMTPRQAAKDEVGRELLESLLLEFEVRSGKQDDEANRVDVAKLRQVLGLKERR
jgi:hypothetical protein